MLIIGRKPSAARYTVRRLTSAWVEPTKECTIIVWMSVSSRASSGWRQASPPSYLKESFSLVR
jgi:hypothetical protein